MRKRRNSPRPPWTPPTTRTRDPTYLMVLTVMFRFFVTTVVIVSVMGLMFRFFVKTAVIVWVMGLMFMFLGVMAVIVLVMGLIEICVPMKLPMSSIKLFSALAALLLIFIPWWIRRGTGFLSRGCDFERQLPRRRRKDWPLQRRS